MPKVTYAPRTLPLGQPLRTPFRMREKLCPWPATCHITPSHVAGPGHGPHKAVSEWRLTFLCDENESDNNAAQCLRISAARRLHAYRPRPPQGPCWTKGLIWRMGPPMGPPWSPCRPYNALQSAGRRGGGPLLSGPANPYSNECSIAGRASEWWWRVQVLTAPPTRRPPSCATGLAWLAQQTAKRHNRCANRCR